jgi:hypothetical protein
MHNESRCMSLIAQIPFPSLAGQSVIDVQAVLLALDHCHPNLPRKLLSSGMLLDWLSHYSGGTAPALHRSSLLSP